VTETVRTGGLAAQMTTRDTVAAQQLCALISNPSVYHSHMHSAHNRIMAKDQAGPPPLGDDVHALAIRLMAETALQFTDALLQRLARDRPA